MHFEDGLVIFELPISETIKGHIPDVPAVELAQAGALLYLVVIWLFDAYEGGTRSETARDVCGSACLRLGGCRLDVGKSTDGQVLQLRQSHHQQGLDGFDVVVPQVDGDEEGELDVTDLGDRLFLMVLPLIIQCVHKMIPLALHSLMRGATS